MLVGFWREIKVFKNHYNGVASGSSVPSIHKPRGNGVKNTASSGSEHGFVSHGFDLNSGRSNKKRLFLHQTKQEKDTKEEDTRSSYTMWCLLANEYENDVIYLGRYCTCAIFFYMKKFHIIELEMYYNTSGIINYGYFIQEVESIKKISENVAQLSGVSKWAMYIAAFPAQDKRLDALMLCTDEVFMYLGENLKLTPQKDVEPEPNLPLQKIIILDPDDHPMWESAKTIAPTPSSAIVKVDVDDNFVINSTYLKYRFGYGELRTNPTSGTPPPLHGNPGRNSGGIFRYNTPNQAFQFLDDKVLFEHDWPIKSKNEHHQKSVAFADRSNSNKDIY
ncbi:hypothetical protein Tco_0604548 [Tanacetum coccineum]